MLENGWVEFKIRSKLKIKYNTSEYNITKIKTN